MFCRFSKAKPAACLLLLLSISLALAQNAPPVAPVREVTDDYFGTKVVDPYRWMEDSKNPETVAWMKAQADYTRDYLGRLPMRQTLLERISKLSDAGVKVDGIQRRGNLYFYDRLAPGENVGKLCVRDGLNGEECLLVDPEKLSEPDRATRSRLIPLILDLGSNGSLLNSEKPIWFQGNRHSAGSPVRGPVGRRANQSVC
jgi:hypothetical protein